MIFKAVCDECLNRLSASVRIWTALNDFLFDFMKDTVLIAFRLQSEFGHGLPSRYTRTLHARVLIAFRLQSEFGRKAGRSRMSLSSWGVLIAFRLQSEFGLAVAIIAAFSSDGPGS